MGTYRVVVVRDDDLPEGVESLFVRVQSCLQFWLRESAAREPRRLERVLSEAWEDYRRIEADELMSWPPTLRAAS